MNKSEKVHLLKAALSGDRKEVERIMNATKAKIFVSVSKSSLYCTFEHACTCKEPEKCTYAKPREHLAAIYPNALFVDVWDGTGESEQSMLMARFGASESEIAAQLEKNAGANTRNEIIKLQNKFKNE